MKFEVPMINAHELQSLATVEIFVGPLSIRHSFEFRVSDFEFVSFSIYSHRTTRSPVSNWLPGWTSTSAILPSRSAYSVVSIFMASIETSF